MTDEPRNHSVSIQGVSWSDLTRSEVRQLERDHQRLTEIGGVGWKKAALLLKEFGSYQEVRSADVDELVEVEKIGQSLAQRIAED